MSGQFSGKAVVKRLILKAALRRARASLPFRDTASNSVVFVFGTGRSGTTWLAEQLADATHGRIVFEPLHPSANSGRSWVGARKYLRMDETADEWREVFDPLVNGTVRHPWIDRYNARFSYPFRVIKLIRGNLMLGWVARNYPQARIALVVRDPSEVALSQLKGKWPIEIERFTSQEKLMEDYPVFGSDLFANASNQFRLNILHWAIENKVAMDQLNAARAQGAACEIFSYNKLQGAPDMFRGFLDFCGAPPDEEAVSQLDRPSRVSRGSRPKVEPSVKDRQFVKTVVDELGLARFSCFITE